MAQKWFYLKRIETVVNKIFGRKQIFMKNLKKRHIDTITVQVLVDIIGL